MTSVFKNLSRSPGISLSLLGICLALASTGCQTLSLVATDSSIPATTMGQSSDKYQIIMKRTFGKTTSFNGTIDGPIAIQEALEESGAIDKFRGMDIVLMRKVDGEYRPLRMPVTYNYGSGLVTDSENYALQDDDLILISPQSNNLMDKVLSSVGGGIK